MRQIMENHDADALNDEIEILLHPNETDKIN